MSNQSSIEFARDGSLARVTLNRPDAANGIDMALARELLTASIACRSDPAVRAVLLTANGRMFCAGGDLKGFAEHGDTIYAYLKELAGHLHAAMANFARMRAPLVVAVQGAAAGAGLSLAVAGDLVLAARSAKFTMAYTAAGLVPDGGASYLLPRLIGLRRTQELVLTNRRLGAEEAQEWGLVTRVVEDAELAAEAENLARQIAEGPTAAYGAVKRLLLESYGASLETQMELEASAIAEAGNGPDGREGVAAFIDKRAARFRGA